MTIQDWSGQRASNIASEICGFLTVLAGTIVLHSTREPDQTVLSGRSMFNFLETAMTHICLCCYLNNNFFCVCIITAADLYTPLPPKIYWHIQENGDIGKQKEDDSLTCEFITVVRQDYFV
jgi:magnesium transporter